MSVGTNSATGARRWYAACPRGIESLLSTELSQLGAVSTRETVAGVHFEGPVAVAYRACLWSRLANRILMPVVEFDAPDADALYAGLRQVAWGDLFGHRSTLAIDFSGTSGAIRNTRFGVQKSKDAVMDWFRANGGHRPQVEPRTADIRFSLRLSRNRLSVALDLSGGSLHQRGYRSSAGQAPLKENLAAALLLRADWPGMAARGGALIDPMCGSGTLLLEGALMAADIAPGLERRRFGFEHWREHNADQWGAMLAEARGRAERGRSAQLPEIRGYDADPRVIRRAEENIARAGLEKSVRVSCKPLAELKKPTHKPLPDGLVISNPPYGERLGDKGSLAYLYQELGRVLATEFDGWQAAILTSDLELGKAIGLRSHKRYTFWNGPIEAYLLLFELTNNTLNTTLPEKATAGTAPDAPLSEGATMFANRIRKNRRRLSSWLKRKQVSCYRLYDADMPEYAVAVDVYGDAVHVAEYQAPKGVDADAAERRLGEVRAALPEALGVAPEQIVYKQRRRQRGAAQYEKQDSRQDFFSVTEAHARLLVNLHDYLDTGLFLDHRPLRLRIAREARGKAFLHMFCFTGSATVLAALGGARSTTSVDMSNTYLDWLRKNLAHNGLGENQHKWVRANCLEWLLDDKSEYDLILLDPPSFSNSKSMADSFDVQRDHPQLVRSAMARLREGGTLYFSNNRRGFKLDPALQQEFDCVDITAKTLDPDFQRNRRIHCCWQISAR